MVQAEQEGYHSTLLEHSNFQGIAQIYHSGSSSGNDQAILKVSHSGGYCSNIRLSGSSAEQNNTRRPKVKTGTCQIKSELLHLRTDCGSYFRNNVSNSSRTYGMRLSDTSIPGCGTFRSLIASHPALTSIESG
jgi:hypothetical protein